MKRTLLGLLISGAVVALPFLFATSVQAVDVLGDACGQAGNSAVCNAQGDDVNSMIENVTNALLFFLGAVAVIVIITGGLMYITAAGDAGKVKNAKNTILYAVVGLVVALLAWGIVSFVVNAVG
ncbi:MAG: Mbov_0395 family pilin-like conjugal transfer protein [Candidatus Saccharimonadales bacterium]